MRSKKPLVAAVALLSAAYLAWPYATLFRLAAAVRQGDAATLEEFVEWDEVREGIKEDICDTVFDTPDIKVANTESRLPPFGYSFVRGIASNAIDEEVSAESLVSASHAASLEPAGGHASKKTPKIVWAFFANPTTFSVLLRPPGATKHQLVRLRLELEHGAWKVTRVWLPPTMLAQANAPG